jgi:hypothetical protein
MGLHASAFCLRIDNKKFVHTHEWEELGVKKSERVKVSKFIDSLTREKNLFSKSFLC